VLRDPAAARKAWEEAAKGPLGRWVGGEGKGAGGDGGEGEGGPRGCVLVYAGDSAHAPQHPTPIIRPTDQPTNRPATGSRTCGWAAYLTPTPYPQHDNSPTNLQMTNQPTDRRRRYADVWLGYAAFERSLRAVREARGVFKRAYARKMEEGGQAVVCAEWLRFEREEGRCVRVGWGGVGRGAAA
jgi:hypothetical protein